MDVRSGTVVHASGGDRQEYRPLSESFDLPDEPVALARRIRRRWGERLLYLADLDALEGERRQVEVLEGLAAVGHDLRVDGAVRSRRGARILRDAGAAEVVVGLETLPAWDRVEQVAETVGTGRTVVSLDLRADRPVGGPAGAGRDPGSLTRSAAASGAGRVVVLDLERVGSGGGLDPELLRRCRHAAPEVGLTAAGGIRGVHDVRAAGRAGCDECMVATALYGGRLAPSAVRRLEDDGPEPG